MTSGLMARAKSLSPRGTGWRTERGLSESTSPVTLVVHTSFSRLPRDVYATRLSGHEKISEAFEVWLPIGVYDYAPCTKEDKAWYP